MSEKEREMCEFEMDLNFCLKARSENGCGF